MMRDGLIFVYSFLQSLKVDNSLWFEGFFFNFKNGVFFDTKLII